MKQSEIESYKETANVWQDLYPEKELTPEEGEEIQRNIVGAFNVLLEWEEKEANHGKGSLLY